MHLENSRSECTNKNHNFSGASTDPNYHRNDEQVHIKLEPGANTLKPLSLKFIRLSSKATVTHLRKYVAQQVLNDISKFNEVCYAGYVAFG